MDDEINRHKSEDSRFWGFVPDDHIVGKPVFIWFSIKGINDGIKNWKIRWDRVFTTVDGPGKRTFLFSSLYRSHSNLARIYFFIEGGKKIKLHEICSLSGLPSKCCKLFMDDKTAKSLFLWWIKLSETKF